MYSFSFIKVRKNIFINITAYGLGNPVCLFGFVISFVNSDQLAAACRGQAHLERKDAKPHEPGTTANIMNREAAELERLAARLADGLRDAFAATGVAAQVTQAFTLVGVFFADAPVHNYVQAQGADHKRYASFFHGLLDRGVYFAPSGYETLFPSLAHTDADIDRTITAAAESVHTEG